VTTTEDNIARLEKQISDQYNRLANADYAGLDPDALLRKLGEDEKSLRKVQAFELAQARALEETRSMKRGLLHDIRETKYLLREYRKSPYSPRKTHFQSEAAQNSTRQ
jgi:hypothetical protein